MNISDLPHAQGNEAAYADLVAKLNAASTDDDLLNDKELEKFIESIIPGDVSKDQMQRLIKIYGGGDVVSKDTILLKMTGDGFLSYVPGQGWTKQWDNIDELTIARALFVEAGLDPDDPAARMTPDQFNAAVDRLFGDEQGQSLDQAGLQARIFGTGNTLSVDQLARVFEPDGMHIDGVTGEGYVRVFVNPDNLTPRTPEEALNYFASFDEDGDGTLSVDEFHDALNSMSADGASVGGDIPARLARLYGAGGDADTVSLDAIGTMMSEGVLVTSNEKSNGFDVDLNAVTNERLVEAMFRYVGKDPATDTLTAREFDEGTDHVLGDWMPIRKDSGEYLARVHGTAQPDGTYTMTAEQVLEVFTSGDVVREDAAGRDFIPISSTIDDELPAHHSHHWWDTALHALGDEVGDVIATMSDIVGIAEEDLANILNGKMSLEEAAEAGAHDIGAAIQAAIQRGETRAIELMDQLGHAIKEGIHDLSEDGKKFVDTMLADIKAGASIIAIRTLAAMSGMTSDQAKEALESAGEKLAKVTHLSSLTFEDMKAMIPDFDALMEEGARIQREFFGLTVEGDAESPDQGLAVPTVDDVFSDLNSAERAAFKQRLLDDGLGVDHQGRLLTETGDVATKEEKQSWYDKYMRVDIGAEIQAVFSDGAAFDAVQVRPFFSMPRRDENGDLVMEFRFRELDMVGGALGSGDVGLAAFRDIVVPFYVSGPKAGQKKDIIYNSTVAALGEYAPSGPLTGSTLAEGTAMFQSFLATLGVGDGAAVPGPGEGLERLARLGATNRLEMGGAVGLTTSYNLTEMGGFAWMPFVAEIIGGAAAAGVASLAILGAEAESAGTLTAAIAEFGPQVVHAAGMLGAMGIDLLFAEELDAASTTFGGFAWAAYNLGKNGSAENPFADGTLDTTARSRAQINFGSPSYTVIA